MEWIIFFSIGFLLCISLRYMKNDEEAYFWPKMVAYYASALAVVELGGAIIPAGLAIALFLIKKKSTLNSKVKMVPLTFGMIYFLLSLFLPPIPVTQVFSVAEQFKQIEHVDHVEAVHTYSKDSFVQERIQSYDDSSPMLQMATWVLDHRGIDIQDRDWLMKASNPEQLNYQLEEKQINELTTHVYLRFVDGSGEYIGLFKRTRQESPFYLIQMIEHTGMKK